MRSQDPIAAPTSVATSAWTDSATGTREEARFIGPEGQHILTFLHRPASPATGGVVLCGSIYEDFQINYRRELLLARELARRGVATIRFHYRSTGNSDAVASGALTTESMTADATAATRWLQEAYGLDAVTYCGSRLGALVAARMCDATPDSALVLWAPLLSGADFFRGMSRASAVAGVRAEARKRHVATGTEKLFASEDQVDLLGNLVHRASYEDLKRLEMPTRIAGGRRVLLVQLGATEALTVPNKNLTSDWRDGGAIVDVLLVQAR